MRRARLPELHLLPALPAAWPEGAVHGLRAREGLEVDLAWRNGNLVSAEIRATHAVAFLLRLGSAAALERVEMASGGSRLWRTN